MRHAFSRGTLAALALSAPLLMATAPAVAQNTNDEGFLPLFDGTDLSKWTIPEGDNGHWKLVDQDGGKVIDYDARSEAPGAKDLVTKQEFGNYVLKLDWRIKETPYMNPGIPYVLPDGTHAHDVKGKPLSLTLPDSDSGVFPRYPFVKAQVNIWCWPIGSGEVYGYRMDAKMPPEVRAGVTPKTQADKPVGEWNEFEITMLGDRLTVVLNGTKVLDDAQLPDVPARADRPAAPRRLQGWQVHRPAQPGAVP